MKKKGFTLIELLAVIVILAIIALIATPLVLKYIEKSRKESKVDSAYSFVRNLETEIANFSIKNNGKKYNGQPSDKGYYELTSFESSEIDITVKGDKPNSVKVCLSSLGQVDKAMFEYGKYYVSYDGKKGSISDKDTYDNFSCGGNSGNMVSNYIIDADVNFAYDETQKVYAATLPIAKDISSQFDEEFDYDFIIDNGEPYLIYNVNFVNSLLVFMSHVKNISETIGIGVGEDRIIFTSPNEITGLHNVKITNKRKLEEKTYFWITDPDSNVFELAGEDLVPGAANVIIKDENGNQYYNATIELIDDKVGGEKGAIGDLPYLNDVYTDLTNGKTITIEVTQGNDVFTISKNLNSMMYAGNLYFTRYNKYVLDVFAVK